VRETPLLQEFADTLDVDRGMDPGTVVLSLANAVHQSFEYKTAATRVDSPIDEALGYQRLMDEFQVAQSEVARLVGRDRSTVSNVLRLLKLPDSVRTLLHQSQLSEGHARALLGLANPVAIEKLAHEAAVNGWSVREVEERVRGDAPTTRRPRTPKGAAQPTAQSADARRVEDALRRRLGTDVRLTAKRRGRGALTISYYSNDDLARVLELILGIPFDG